ncbi:MAG: hypothetical protein Q4C95_05525 [Planctomycetia bacterium]|nr:hypothetical protein [Planctomycetia bacterium]
MSTSAMLSNSSKPNREDNPESKDQVFSQNNDDWIKSDQILIERLKRTQREVKWVDFLSTLTALLTLGCVLFLIGIIFDHWVFSQGFSIRGRILYFGLISTTLSACFIYRIYPIFCYRINPLYAAKVLEENQEEVKNSIINWLLLRRELKNRKANHVQSSLQKTVLKGVIQQATKEMATFPDQMTVDHMPLIRWGIAFVVVLFFFSGYSIFSPKNPFVSIARLSFPVANIKAPLSVRFLKIDPGNVKVFQNEKITIKAEISGVGNQPVFLSYSTLDGRFVNQKIEIPLKEGNLFEMTFPLSPEGLTESLNYQIVVGNPGRSESRSETFFLEVRPAITFEVERLTLKFPEYSQMKDQILYHSGDINALEGTVVEIVARSNTPLKKALFVPDRLDKLAKVMTINPNDPTCATYSFSLDSQKKMGNQTEKQPSTYELRCVDDEGNKNLTPNVYQIIIMKDQSPQIFWETKTKDDLSLPINKPLPLKIRANDPDFGLSSISLRLALREKQGDNGRSLRVISPQNSNIELFNFASFSGSLDNLTQTSQNNLAQEKMVNLSTGIDQQSKTKFQDGECFVEYELVPEKLGLQVGDEVEYWAEAFDNRKPESNFGTTEKRTLLVVEKSNSPDNQNEEAKGNDSDENGNQNDSSENQDKSNNNQQSTEQSDSSDDSQNQSEKNSQNKENSQNVEQNENESEANNSSGDQKDNDNNQNDSQKNQKNDNNQQNQKNKQNQENNQNLKEQQKNQPSSEDQQSNEGQGNSDDNDGENQNSDKNQQTNSENRQSSPNTEQDSSNNNSGSGRENNNNNNPNDSTDIVDNSNQNNNSTDSNNSTDDPGNNQKESPNDSPSKSGKASDLPIDPEANPGEAFERILDQMKKTENQSKQNSQSKPSSMNNPIEDQEDASNENSKSDSPDEESDPNNQAPKNQPSNPQNIDPSNEKQPSQSGNLPAFSGNEPLKSDAERIRANSVDLLDPGLKRQQGEIDPRTNTFMTTNATPQDQLAAQPVDPNSNIVDDPDQMIEPLPADKNKTPNSNKTSEHLNNSANNSNVDPNQANIVTKDDLKNNNKQNDRETSNASDSFDNINLDSIPDNAALGSGKAGDHSPIHLPLSQDDSGHPAGETGTNSSEQPNNRPEFNNDDSDFNQPNKGNPNSSKRGTGGYGTDRDVVEEKIPFQADSPHLLFTEKATSLALQYLEDQLKNGPDQELLNELGWDQNQLQAFLNKWQEMKKNAQKFGENSQERQYYLESLRDLGLRDSRSNDSILNDSHSNEFRDPTTSQQMIRSKPPASFEERFRAYHQGISTKK